MAVEGGGRPQEVAACGQRVPVQAAGEPQAVPAAVVSMTERSHCAQAGAPMAFGYAAEHLETRCRRERVAVADRRAGAPAAPDRRAAARRLERGWIERQMAQSRHR